jgi:hypothetical protein
VEPENAPRAAHPVIDRAQFLLITAALAAANGCGGPAAGVESAHKEPAEEQVSIPGAQPPPAATAEAHANAGPDYGRVGGLGDFGGAPINEHPFVPPPPVVALPTAATSCPVLTGVVGDCTTLKAPPGPHCESFADTKSECEHFATTLQPRVAQKAIACVLATSGTRAVCDFDLTAKCAYGATANACVDATLAPKCDAAIAACGGKKAKFSKADCLRVASAVGTGQRTSTLSCIAESCGTASCLYGLSWSLTNP